MTSFLLYKSLLICYLRLLGCTLAGNTNGVTWLFPTTGQILHYEDTVNVTWTSHFSSPLLYTFCFNSTDNFAIQEAYQAVTPYNGSQLIQLVWQGISSCNFDLRPNTTAGNGANSPVFVVLPSSRAVATTVGLGSPSSTSSASSTAGLPSSSSTSSGAATATGPSNSTETSHTPSNSGLSSGAKAGIGIAVAVGAIAVIAGIAFFFLRRRRSKNPPPHSTTTAGKAEDYYGAQQYRQVDSTTGSGVQMQEMNAAQTAKPAELSSNFTHELPGFNVGRR